MPALSISIGTAALLFSRRDSFACSSLMCHVCRPGWQRPPRCRPGREAEPDTWRFHCHHKTV